MSDNFPHIFLEKQEPVMEFFFGTFVTVGTTSTFRDVFLGYRHYIFYILYEHTGHSLTRVLGDRASVCLSVSVCFVLFCALSETPIFDCGHMVPSANLQVASLITTTTAIG
jgi:hypothetical protein